VDGRLIMVRWDSGSSSMFVPSAGCLQVTGHEPLAEAADTSCAAPPVLCEITGQTARSKAGCTQLN
jgi:hypothetical protein